MYKSLALTVGLRYTRTKQRNGFISFISFTSMLGLVLGVAVLIIVLSVMNGFDRELRERVLGMVPHGSIYALDPLHHWQDLGDQLLEQPGVEGVAPFVNGQGMFSHRGQVNPVLFNGILPEQEGAVSILPDHIKLGDLDSLQPGSFNIILGDLLAKNIGVTLGDKVTLILPEANLTVAGVIPRLKRFTVSGVFAVGAELDANLAIMHLADASRLKRLNGAAEGVRIKLDNLFNAPRQVNALLAQLDGVYYASDWTRTHGNLFDAIQLERRMLALLLTLIVAVAAFNIVSTLVMLVVDKQGDIAILRTLGATPMEVMGIFIIQGLVIGFVGVIVGCILGLLVASNISSLVAWLEQLFGFQVLSADVYFISYFPSQIKLDNVMTICITSMLLTLLATLYPAWKASRINPAEVLRYE